MEQQPSTQGSAGTGQMNYAALAVAGGGFLGFIGIFLKWFTVEASVAGFSASASANGTTDWTGVLAAIAALVALAGGAAALIMSDEGIKRMALAVAAIGGVLLLIATVAAFFRTGNVDVSLPAAAEGGGLSLNGKAAVGLYISFLGGVIATVGAALALRKTGGAEA